MKRSLRGKTSGRGAQYPVPSFQYGLNVYASWKPDQDVLSQGPVFQAVTGLFPNPVRAISFAQALHSVSNRKAFKSAWMAGFDGEEKNAFTKVFSSKPIPSGQWIVIPKGTKLSEPIRLSGLTLKSGLHVSHVIIVVGAGSRVTIVEEPGKSGGNAMGVGMSVVELIMHPKAEVQWMIDGDVLKPSFHWAFRRAVLHRDAVLQVFALLKGGKAQKLDVKIDLKGWGSHVDLRQAIVAAEEQEFDCSARIRHRAPHTASKFWTRAILSDHSKVITQGWISVEKRAANINATQQEDGLLLDPGVEFDPIPNLEIQHDEVACAHGVTVSDLDEQLLFYLQSRGLTEHQSCSEIVQGFLTPILDQGHQEAGGPLKNRIDQFIQQWK